MPKAILAAGLLGLLTSLWGGCSNIFQASKSPSASSSSQPAIIMPPYIAGTINEYCVLEGGTELVVTGYGVVVGLGKNGSSEVPANVQKYLTEYLLKQDLGSWTRGTEKLTPARFLADLDTAVVLVQGSIPPGAPAESPFDVLVAALPQTQTKSLSGGTLMPTDMFMSREGITATSRVLARGAGTVFLNPFMDFSTPAGIAESRTGRIIGGGKVVQSRPLSLHLRQGDYSLADLIQRRINERFSEGGRKVANAINNSVIQLAVPREHRHDYRKFLQLLTHLPVRVVMPGAAEVHAKHIGQAMNQADANYDELSLVWEALGKQVLPMVQTFYSSSNNPTAYYAARAGLRMEDEGALEIVIRFAKTSGPLQIEAIRELSDRPRTIRILKALRPLLNADNDQVRVAAYEALRKLGDESSITHVNVSNQFKMDIVSAEGNNVIYASQSLESRLVLFGKNFALPKELFFTTPDDLVTLNATAKDEKISLWRKIPRTGSYSEIFKVDRDVPALVETLGHLPRRNVEGTIPGIGLTYSQTLMVLYGLCKQGDIQAKFVLQPLPGVQKIYKGAATVGRPDMPGQ